MDRIEHDHALGNLGGVVHEVVTGFVVGAQSTADHRRIEVTPVPAGAPPRPYTPAVMAGDTLYLSGNIGTDPKTNAPPEGFADAAMPRCRSN